MYSPFKPGRPERDREMEGADRKQEDVVTVWKAKMRDAEVSSDRNDWTRLGDVIAKKFCRTAKRVSTMIGGVLSRGDDSLSEDEGEGPTIMRLPWASGLGIQTDRPSSENTAGQNNRVSIVALRQCASQAR